MLSNLKTDNPTLNTKLQQKNNDYYKDKEIREIIDNLKEVNHLKNSSLNVGQKISIPTI